MIAGARVLVLSLSFKENCPDLRNTRVVYLIEALERYHIDPEVVDPWADSEEARHEYGFTVIGYIPADSGWIAMVAAFAHREFTALSCEAWSQLLEPIGVPVDLKGIVPRELGALRL